MQRGLIYITFGKKAIEMAKISFKSFKQHNPQIPVAIFTNLPDMAKDFDHIHEYSSEELSDINHYFKETNKFSSLKIRFLKMSPYSQTLYLDSDTFVKGNLDEIFNLLDSNELITTLNADWKWSDDAYYTHDHSNNKKQGLVNLTSSNKNNVNCGVIAYKNTDIIKNFFDVWWLNFQENNSHNEQYVLHRLLEKEICKKLNINRTNIDNTIYNCVGSMWPRIHSSGLWDNCKILHSQRIFQNQHLNINDLYKLDYLQKFI
jgi:hypothetical protein